MELDLLKLWNYIKNLIASLYGWFLTLNTPLQMLIYIMLLYIFIIGLLEFTKKILIWIPKKIIEIVLIGIVAYIFVLYLK